MWFWERLAGLLNQEQAIVRQRFAPEVLWDCHRDLVGLRLGDFHLPIFISSSRFWILRESGLNCGMSKNDLN